MEQKECPFKGFKTNGFLMLTVEFIILALGVCCIALFPTDKFGVNDVIAILLFISFLLNFAGFFSLEPNEAIAMVFFGKYKGTFKTTGFFWINPFMSKKRLSLRARNLNIDPIKVNDKIGNPVLIGLVLVWRLEDTYRAMFEIDSQVLASGNATNNAGQVAGRMRAFENFVKVQSDAALRQVAGQYAYDDSNNNSEELTLRSGGSEINEQLVQKLNERLSMAGIEVVEARLNYLAYAPEIAAVMLRRQQASAIIAAREKIVEGAVSMVKMALDKLKEENIVNLTEEKKASMVGNLLVVLCADEAVQPMLNTGNEETK